MYNVGIIGFGGMGHHHYLALETYDRARVAGVFDINPARIALANGLGLRTYATAEAFFADSAIDAVIVATTNEVHKTHSISALAAGKHVICEKPVTITTAELVEVMAAAERYDEIFTINQNRRTDRDFLQMRKYVEQGLLGEVYAIESRAHGSRGVPKGWRTSKALGGGMMLDWGVHLIDQILHMTDECVVSVFCQMQHIHHDVDDNFRLTLTFESGLTALIEVGTNNFIPLPRWQVPGKQGTLQIDGWDGEGRIVRSIGGDDVWGSEIAPSKAGPSKTMSARDAKTLETIELDAVEDAGSGKGLAAVYNQFFDAVEGKAKLTITPQQALRVLHIMEAAFESSDTNAVIMVNDGK